MKKLFIMALAAFFAANISAQEAKAGKAECKKENQECQHRKKCKMSFEERTEMEIKFLSDELYLDSLQAEKFANTISAEDIPAREMDISRAKENVLRTIDDRR